MDTYPVDVSDLIGEVSSTITVSGEYPLEKIMVGSECYVPQSPASLHVELTDVGEGVLARGSVSVSLQAQCARCLGEFPLDVNGSIDTLFLPANAPEPDDEDTHRIADDDSVDLAPPILAAVVIEIPLAPLHDETCKGLCPTCGEDLNEGDCGCSVDPTDDHPFAALRALVTEET